MSSQTFLRFERWLKQFSDLLASPWSVSGVYVASVLPGLHAYGINPREVFQDLGINYDNLSQPEYRLALFDAFRFSVAIVELTGDDAIGLQLGSQVRPRSFQVLGYAAMSSANLLEAIDRLRRFEKLVWDIGLTELIIEGRTAVLRMNPLGISLVPNHVIELAISGWVHFGRDIIPGDVPLDEVRFRHAQLAGDREYQKVFDCPVTFECGQNEIRFPSSYLRRPLCEADPVLRAMMDQQGEALLVDYEHKANIVNEVRAAVFRVLQYGEPSMEVVAESMSLTPRLLRRRLAASDHRFQNIVDDVRQVMAVQYLHETDLNLIEIAFMLGFSDQSAFTRAFRRWTGQSPGKYRGLRKTM